MQKPTFYFYISILFIVSCNTSFFDKPIPIQLTNILPKNNQNPTQLIYVDENHNSKTIKLSNSQQDSITIPLKKNHLTPILVYTSNLDGEPRGCLYPITTAIDMHSGFAAWIAYRLLIASHEKKSLTHTYLSHFNWQRFINYIKKYENPWILDQDLIIENIADKTFNVYSIREK